MAQLIPAALSAPFAALLADRPQRALRWRLVTSSRRSRSGATGACMVLGLPPLVVYVSAAIAACTDRVHPTDPGCPASGIVPDARGAERCERLSGTVEGAGLFIGPLAAAAILTVGPPAAVFAVRAADRRRGVPGDRVPAVDHPTPRCSVERTRWPASISAAPSPPSDSISSMASGSCAKTPTSGSWSRSWPFAVVIGVLDVLFVLLALDVYDTGASGAGDPERCARGRDAVGGAAAFVLVGRRRLAPALAFAAAVPVALLATAVFGTGTSAPVLIVFAGVGSAACDVAGRTILQRTTPDAVLGRVLGNLEGSSVRHSRSGRPGPRPRVAVGIVEWASGNRRARCCPRCPRWAGAAGRDRSTDARPGARARGARALIRLLTAPPAVLEAVARRPAGGPSTPPRPSSQG